MLQDNAMQLSKLLLTGYQFSSARIPMESGLDPASKFRGSDFSNIWQSSVVYRIVEIQVKRFTFVGFTGGDMVVVLRGARLAVL